MEGWDKKWKKKKLSRRRRGGWKTTMEGMRCHMGLAFLPKMEEMRVMIDEKKKEHKRGGRRVHHWKKYTEN